MNRAAYYVTAAAFAVLFVFPLLWSGWSSIRPGDAFSLDSYRRLATYGEGLGVYVTNTVILVVLTVAGTLTVATLAGYAFARFPFPGRGVLFVLTLAILMVPYPTILIPLYVLLGWLGLQDSLVGLALVMIMFQLPFAVFMMRNAFESVPRTLDEAAMIDGAGSLRVLLRILLPAVVPGLVTVGLFAFLASWNDYVAPLILISSNDRFTLPVAVVNMRLHNFGAVDYPTMQAGVVFMALPCLLLFLILQRYYVRGFMSGALRG
ncbi:carbohydrate ABC transporter permease [Nonomuraea soli]|uniref:Multiple sugar transport system permease protein n=1 Tax=Nonomuraea soli TaxID=1032476 RepID=A0A7W0CGY8_9ACTN|nr:carbohydrate ABC transporter permease [Nonomuraea soli]MBA2890959.1 multiple sugar transport system permease protein [Nonomuraea soli]